MAAGTTAGAGVTVGNSGAGGHVMVMPWSWMHCSKCIVQFTQQLPGCVLKKILVKRFLRVYHITDL